MKQTQRQDGPGPMPVLAKDPNGDLDAGTVWRQRTANSRTRRTVQGVIVSLTHPSDDVVLWTTELADGSGIRIHAGRRAGMNHWDIAPPAAFENGIRYVHTGNGNSFRVIHVYPQDSPRYGEIVALADPTQEAVTLHQSQRPAYEVER